MLKNRVIIGLIFCFLSASASNAATVSFLVMEIGQSKIEAGVQYPALWENNLLDIFFESGHIVSNAPILQLSEKPSNGFPDEAQRDYENAQKGGMGYFMVAIVDYIRSDVSLRLFSTTSRKMLREQKYAVKAFKNTKDEQDNIKKAIRIMTAQLN
ncbi:MAG: hypothetical protein LBG95_07170 [Treponema sp.]|nr:hypothetical protein [Treponema sp.]